MAIFGTNIYLAGYRVVVLFFDLFSAAIARTSDELETKQAFKKLPIVLENIKEEKGKLCKMEEISPPFRGQVGTGSETVCASRDCEVQVNKGIFPLKFPLIMRAFCHEP